MTYDKLIVGSSLEAVLFALYNKIPFLYTKNLKPSRFETIQDYGLGTSLKDIWEKTVFQLSLSGFNLFEDKIKHIRYEQDNKLKIISKEENVYTIKYNTLYVFDDYNFLDLPPSLDTTSDEIRVLDWFEAIHGSVHDLECIEQDSNFMKQIIFYEKKKTFKHKKDVCVISYLNKKELDQYPEYLVKIRTQNLMFQNGIIGKKDKKSSIVLEHINRDIYDLGKNIYKNFENIIFMYSDHKIIYDFYNKRQKIDYMKYLRLKLGL